MNTNVFKSLLCSWCISIASVAGAALVPTINITKLVDNADVIVMGTVVRITDMGPTSVATFNNPVAGRMMSGEMLVDQVLGGPTTLSSVQFQFSVPSVAIGYRGVRSSSYRILFLKRNGEHYEFVSPYYPSVVAIAGSRIQSERPLDKVLEVIASVLRSPDASEAQKREAIDTLWGVNNALATSGLRSMLQQGARTVQLHAIQLHAAAALLAVGDISALPIAEEELLRPDASLPPEALPNLRGGLSRGIMADEAIPALARLLRQGDTETKRAAALALRRTHSPAALRPLADALNDADVEVTHNALMGFAETTGQPEWGPSMPTFLADRERYLAHWKDWMRNR